MTMVKGGVMFPDYRDEGVFSPEGRASYPAVIYSQRKKHPSQGQGKSGLAQHSMDPMKLILITVMDITIEITFTSIMDSYMTFNS